MGVLSLNLKVTICGLVQSNLATAMHQNKCQKFRRVFLMQSVRLMLMLMFGSILRAVEMRHDERVVESEAQELRPLGVVERLSQRGGESGSAAHHAPGVSAGEEL